MHPRLPSLPSPARRRGLLGAAALLLQGCSATGALNAAAGSSHLGQRDVPYGTDPRQRLDVYLAAGDRPAPVVVFFYGGAWTRGERGSYRFVGEALAAAGITTVIPDYRLSPQAHWREILADCAAATRWTVDHADALRAAPGRLHLMGHSAGGYNAAMLALDARWLGAQGLAPSRLAGWIGLAGPYDFLPIGDPDSQVAFDWPRTPADSQPLAHVTRSAPRTLLLAARNDHTVDPQRNTIALGERLRAAGAPVEVELFDRVGHATLVGAFSGPLAWLAPVRERVEAFVTQA